MSWAWLKPIVPASIRPKLRRAWLQLRHYGFGAYCPICQSRLREFVPWVGAVNFRCPVCISKPPHRLAFHYFQQHPELFVSGQLMVHIAPEPELGAWLSRRTRAGGMAYRSGGIGGKGDEHLDIRRLPFGTGSIHLIYCCHVLNVMQEDREAMAEFHRVLHPQGVALLQVPAFYPGKTTLEANDLDERISLFNDPEMYRCYTDEDYVNRLQTAGFDVEHFRAVDLPSEIVQREQLKAEVLHVCRRRGKSP